MPSSGCGVSRLQVVSKERGILKHPLSLQGGLDEVILRGKAKKAEIRRFRLKLNWTLWREANDLNYSSKISHT